MLAIFHDKPSLLEAAFAQDPYPFYARLRTLGRKHGLLQDHASGLWVACTAAQVAEALSHPDLRVRPPGEPVPRAFADTSAGQVFAGLMRQNDGPVHTSGKRWALDVIPTLRPTAQATVALRAAGLTPSVRPLDLLLFEAPVALLAHALGVIAEELAVVARQVIGLVRGWSPTSDSSDREKAQNCAAALLARFGDPNRIGLLTQSCEATAGLIGNALVALRRDAELHERWSTDPEFDDALLREVARYDPPIQNTRRFAAQKSRVCSQDVTVGEGVLVLLASASRDENAYANADSFDADRVDRQEPWTYGRGPHACPGAVLSRRLASALLRDWAAREPDRLSIASQTVRWRYRRLPNARVPWFDFGRAE